MEFRVLGPMEAIEHGRQLAVASGRQRALLAFLLIHANRPVSAERILDELWGEETPESGAKTVAFHVSRLRDALGPGRRHGKPESVIATEPAGYVLRVAPEAIDAVRFERLILEARDRLAGDLEAARARLEDALSLWRGEPYSELADEPFIQPEIRRLEELRLRGLEDRLEADLALGRHAEVIEELESLVAAYPLRERFRGQLMTALYRAGRQSEALRTYGEGRQVLADELGIDPGPELQQLQGSILRQDPRLDAPACRRAARNPYKGLRPFEERDSTDFFGREALVDRLLERLASVARAGRFLAVVGPSGSGKSSAVRAGLIPAVRAGALPGSERWRIAMMMPGARPMRELAAAVASIAPDGFSGLGDRLKLDGGLAAVLDEIAPEEGRVLLVIDQFEELYSLVEDEVERSRFLAELANALARDDARLLAVAALRADFFAQPLVSPTLGELVRTGTEIVTPLTRDELERAIVQPAASVGVAVDAGLTAEVIADVSRQPGELPLLQYALTELFERSDGRRLSREGYEAVGGVLGALARRAEEVYAALDSDAREVARQAFLRLVAPGEAGEPAARRVPLSELLQPADDRRRTEEVLSAFDRGRLLSFDRDAVTGEATVQVAHEALLTRWPRLATWIEGAREDLWTRRRLAEATGDWLRSGRDQGFLLSGSRLDLFASWAGTSDLRPRASETELLEASVAERRRLDDVAAARLARERTLERRAATRLRALVGVLAVALVAGSVLSAAVFRQSETAEEQAALAYARELAAASIGNLGADPRLSLLLAWQAANATADRGYVVEEAMDALHWALQASHVTYPPGRVPVAARAGPRGATGVPLFAPNTLMNLVATASGRALTAEECRTYLHRDECAQVHVVSSERALQVHTRSAIVPVERLAGDTLAGTRVDVVSQLPIDIPAFATKFESSTHIHVEGAGTYSDLEARIGSGEIPDVAIVSRPALVAELAREGLLVDMSGFVDVDRLRANAGDYLVGLATAETSGKLAAVSAGFPAGSSPAVTERLYGAPIAVEDESLIWYPKAAFEKAGYAVPETWTDLMTLTRKMVSDGLTPWCLGLEAGNVSGGGAAFVDDLMLRRLGPARYDAEAEGRLSFAYSDIGWAFVEFGNLAFDDRNVFGGRSSALRTADDLAALPMFLDPPRCWLYLGGGSRRLSWPDGGSGKLAAFPFPTVEPSTYSGYVRGRAYSVVVFHDRPEVRRFVDAIFDPDFAAALATPLARAGIWTLGQATSTLPAGISSAERRLLTTAVRTGSFRVSTYDLLPDRVLAAFQLAMTNYVTYGASVLEGVLDSIDDSWIQTRKDG